MWPLISLYVRLLQRAFHSESNRGFEAAKSSPFKELSILDQLLTPLVFITMVVGVVLGEFAPSIRNALNTAKFDGVSIRAHFP